MSFKFKQLYFKSENAKEAQNKCMSELKKLKAMSPMSAEAGSQKLPRLDDRFTLKIK